jgi:hypothetical protein
MPKPDSLQIDGKILSEAEYQEISVPTDADIAALPDQWRRAVPPRFAKIINAKG